jgi:hypothetical protein
MNLISDATQHDVWVILDFAIFLSKGGCGLIYVRDSDIIKMGTAVGKAVIVFFPSDTWHVVCCTHIIMNI